MFWTATGEFEYTLSKNTIDITPHGEGLLEEQLVRGPYRTPEEVIESALETLRNWSRRILFCLCRQDSC